MVTQTQTRELTQESHQPQWSLCSRIAFRFCFLYLSLFSINIQILAEFVPIPNIDVPDPGTLWPMRQIVFWTASHVFGVKQPIVYTGSGSGDKTFDWVLVFCLLVFAVVGTGVWSVFDRKRRHYVALDKWFRLYLRFALASEMLIYGVDKAIPLQMPFPYLTKLVEPYGNFSPMGVLWSSIGASRAYEMFAGCAEMLGGILLVFPRTATLGALVCVADLIQIFVLNMTYDVPVKVLSFHLLLIALFLLLPEFSRLADFFFRNRVAEPSRQPELFRTHRANRVALVVQIGLGALLIAMNLWGGWDSWHKYGGGSPKSPLYGIWNIEQMTIDGQVRSPLLTDYDRFRRAIFDFPERMAFQRMDDSFARYGASINISDGTLALTKDDDKNWKARFNFRRPSPDQLILDGQMDGHRVQMQFKLMDRGKFLLVSRGFHWIQEYPFNR